MNIVVSDLCDALLSAGADEAKARRAAEGMADTDRDFKARFSKIREDNQKMRTEMAELRGSLQRDMAELCGALRQEMQQMRGEMSLIKWVMGVVIGLAAAILLRVLFV